MARKDLPKKVTVRIPWASGDWEPSSDERAAAWELYVELVTRIAVQPLGEEEGSLREAMTSLYALFDTTRQILKSHGAGVAIAARKGRPSFGSIAVGMLNDSLRPLLAKWHPLLQAHEATRAPSVSAVEHERAWPRAREFRDVLMSNRKDLTTVADAFSEACGVTGLHERARSESH